MLVSDSQYLSKSIKRLTNTETAIMSVGKLSYLQSKGNVQHNLSHKNVLKWRMKLNEVAINFVARIYSFYYRHLANCNVSNAHII